MNRKAHTACQNCSGRRQNLSSGAFRSKFPFGSGLGQTRKPAAQKLRRCKQRIPIHSYHFPGQSAHTSARCPSESVFASDSRRRSGRCARHSRCATQNCRSATSGKSRGRRPVHILCKAQADSGAENRSGPRRGPARPGRCGHYSSARTPSRRAAAGSGQRERQSHTP